MPVQFNQNRKDKYNKLPDRVKQINTALVELNNVVSSGDFKESDIWGDAAADDIVQYMQDKKVYGKLTDAVTALLDGLPGASGVTTAIDAAMKGLQGVIAEIDNTAKDLKLNNRADAFKRLITPHTPGEYAAGDLGNFGFFPAIEGVINAAAGSNADSSSILGPLQKVMDLAADAEAIEDFVKFATGSVQLLGRALTPKTA